MDNKMRIWLKLMKVGAKLGCHQRPERSFFISGFQFPVCARCTGLLLGYISAIILWRCLVVPFSIYSILILPIAIDGMTQYLGFRKSTQFLRVITGILGGYGLVSIQIMILVKIIEISR